MVALVATLHQSSARQFADCVHRTCMRMQELGEILELTEGGAFDPNLDQAEQQAVMKASLDSLHAISQLLWSPWHIGSAC